MAEGAAMKITRAKMQGRFRQLTEAKRPDGAADGLR
jgi:hypothetical protein